MTEIDPAQFTHLRVHSSYSLLRGVPSVTELAQRAAAAGMRALSLTDVNGLYGAVSFTRACRQENIVPLLGMSLGLSVPPEGLPDEIDYPGQLVLLATGIKGYRSLCALSAALQGHPDREARLRRGLPWETLKENAAGLICLEAGQSGWLARYLIAGRPKAASRYAGRLGAIFSDCCFVGLELYGHEDAELAQEMVLVGARFGMLPVVAQPVYYLEPEDAPLLHLLAAIRQNHKVDEVPPLPAGEWLSPAAVSERFAAFPEAVANVSRIIRRCRPALPDGTAVWPALDLPENRTAAEMLQARSEQGLVRLQLNSEEAEYVRRLAHELAAINRHGFAPLFLLVADLVEYARTRDIPVSTRGSVANSLVAYLLGITTIDPVVHSLLFERFLNPARANLPDIDLDFCSRRRDEVLAYVRNKYGSERVALVGTMNTLQPKSAVREVAKAYGYRADELKRLAGLLPHYWRHPDPQRRAKPDVSNLLAEVDDETDREILQQAFRLIGQPHHLSLHPGGIVITPGPLTDLVPVQWATKGYLATQFDFRDVEEIGLPKIDLLGIRALTVLADTADSIRANHDPDFRLADIPLSDEKTAGLLTRGETIGVFQCESTGAQRTLRQLRVTGVADLAAANAFFKPGPATGGMARSFIRRYRGEEKVTYLHPALEGILAPTYGILLFQEQVLRIAVNIAGMDWEQADHLRRGMSKFQAREMAAMRVAFISGCCRAAPDGPDFEPQQAATLWEQVMAFAGYGFNQGHATAYADISYRSAYLKAHYPAEFLCARLQDRGGFHHQAIYMAEARRLGLSIYPPHVNYSSRKVVLDRVPGSEPRLWLGLGMVRDLRRASIRAIRQKRPFTTLRDFMDKVPLQAKEIEHLIKVGALDGLGESRAAMLAAARAILRAGSARQMAFDFAVDKNVAPERPERRLVWEKKLLGCPISVHPLALHPVPDQAVSLRQLPGYRDRYVTVAGVRLPGWTGDKGWFLEDGDGFIVARGGRRPAAWEAVTINGRYRVDKWGGGWIQVESIN